MNATSLLRRYARTHNEGVKTGDFSNMLALFQPDAEMRFEGIPYGPLKGKGAISEAFQKDPPDDVLELYEISGNDTEACASYGWQHLNGRVAGNLNLTANGGFIQQLVIAASRAPGR